MKAGYRHLSYLVLTTALIAPVALGTQAAAQDDKRQDDSQHNDKKQARVYDRTHKDYHNWNDSEDRSYRVPRAKPRRLSRLLEVESYPAGPILELAPQSSRLREVLRGPSPPPRALPEHRKSIFAIALGSFTPSFPVR